MVEYQFLYAHNIFIKQNHIWLVPMQIWHCVIVISTASSTAEPYLTYLLCLNGQWVLVRRTSLSLVTINMYARRVL